MIDLSLKDLLNKRNPKFIDSEFVELYKKLSTDKYAELTEQDKNFILSTAVVFLNQIDRNIKKFGYSIILRYANAFHDYIPLYDVSVNLGFIPIAKFIEQHEDLKLNFGTFWADTIMDQTKREEAGETQYLTNQQYHLQNCMTPNNNSAIIAPTSYGKSELVINYLISNCLNRKQCIIVPTKALLYQTKSRILRNLIQNGITNVKIITHPDMYTNESSFICILTQERLLTLITKHTDFSLDELVIDEAHNLLDDSDRSVLLSQVILLANKRNPNLKLKYLSPFIMDINSLKIKYLNKNWKTNQISEFLKVEKYYLYSDNTLKQYDPFLDINIESKGGYNSAYDVIYENSSNKNIIYTNKPKDTEYIAKHLSNTEQDIDIISESKEYKAIMEYLDTDYNLLDCMKHGVVYHHGSMPDIIKLYVEELYKKDKYIKYIVTTSTLLEGVNIPANRIFLMSINKGPGYLTHANFMNLTGRICRFKEIFNSKSGDLNLLEPKVFVLENNFIQSRTNLENYISSIAKVVKDYPDKVKNPLLENSSAPTTVCDSKIAFLENVETGTIQSPETMVTYVSSEIAKLCFKNIVTEFDIIKNEKNLIANYCEYKSKDRKISNSEDVMDAIYNIFIKNIEITKPKLKRLFHQETRNFYSMIMGWLANGAVYKVLIKNFVSYWSKFENEPKDVYVGSSWGEKIKFGGHEAVYIDISTKSPKEKINLAIVKIKEEKEFVEYYLMKFVEILYALGEIEDNLYNQLKYGSNDKNIISMLQNGFSLELSICLRDKYFDTIIIDESSNEIYTTDATIEAMSKNDENDILLFEAKYYKK